LKKVKTANKINLSVITFIAISFLIQIICVVVLKDAENAVIKVLCQWVCYYLPICFLSVDCMVLLTGMVWIHRTIKSDPKFKGNVKWMAFNTYLLVEILVAFIVVATSGKIMSKFNYQILTFVLLTIEMLLTAFILNKHNSRHKENEIRAAEKVD
jgi:hypothetical protein